MPTTTVTVTGGIAAVTVDVARGLTGDAGSDANVTNANVNAAIEEDPAATRSALELNSESGELIYFFEDAADSVIAGYKVMDNPLQAESEAFVTQSTISEGQIIEEWITETGKPGATFIPDGAWQVHLNAYKTGGSKSTHVYVEVYKRVLAGTETLLGTTALSIALTGVEVALPAFSVYIAGQTLLATDRLVAKVRLSLVGGGSNPTSVTIGYSGTTAARLTLPAQAIDATTLLRTTDIGDSVAAQVHTHVSADITDATDNASSNPEKVLKTTAGGNLTLGSLQTSGAGGLIETAGSNAYIQTNGLDAYIATLGDNAFISTSGANAFIQTRSTFNLTNGSFTTTLFHSATAARTITLPGRFHV